MTQEEIEGLVKRLDQQGADAFHKHYSLGMWKLCAEAASVIRQLLQAQTWRPIEEAPPMKNLLLFAVTDLGENGEAKNWKMDTGYFSTGANVWTWSGYQVSAGHIRPTHWMPLPEPPSSDQQSRE